MKFLDKLAPSRPQPSDRLGRLLQAGHGPFRFRAFGTSMLPAIAPGSLLTVERVAASCARAGDVVMVLRRGEPLVHRLVERDGCLFLKGDALAEPDGPLHSFEWVGVVTAVAPMTRSHQALRLARRLLHRLRMSASRQAPQQRPRAWPPDTT